MTPFDKCIDKNFNGLLLHDSNNFKLLKEFLTLEKNLKDEDNDISNSIVICCEDKNNCLDFAVNIMHTICDLEIINEYSYNPTENTIPCIFDNFKNDITWEKLVDIAINNKILILCTNKEKLNDLKDHSDDSFYNIFTKVIYLNPISIDEILNSAHFMFNNLVETENYTIEEDFFDALDEYIRTIYERSTLENKSFILDLIYRISQKNLELNQVRTLNASSIPFYIKRKDTNIIINEIKNKLAYSSCITDVINYANIANDISKLSLVNSSASFDAIIKSSNIENIQSFAKLYADLLYSKDFSILSSNRVQYIEASKLIRNNASLEGQHGIYVITQKDNLLTIEELGQINLIISNYKKTYGNRIIWLFSATSLDDYVQKNIKTISPSLHQIFDLDIKDDESIRNFYNLYTNKKHIKIVEEEYNKIYNSLSLSENMQIAECYLDRIVTHYITNEKDKITLNYYDNNKNIIDKQINAISNQANKKTNYSFDKVIEEENIIHDKLINIPYNNENQNILLLAMSKLPARPSVNKYIFKNNNIEGFYVGQLEPTPKMLSKLLAEQGKRLDYIYVLTSYDADKVQTVIDINTEETSTNTAFSYFKERCKCMFGNEVEDRIIKIQTYKDNITEDIESALYNLHKHLAKNNTKVNLYLDNHGSMRINALITDAISILIDNQKNIKLIDTYSLESSDNKTQTYTFKISNDEKQIFNFVSGIKEFLNFGSSKSLNEFINNRQLNNDDIELIKAINNVSETMKVCNPKGFSNSLKQLKKLINERKEINSSSYLDIVIDMIKDDYQVDNTHNLLDQKDDESSVPQELQWCANKEHIQQALTLMEARTAEHLQNKGIINFNCNKSIVIDLYNDWINTGIIGSYAEQYIKESGTNKTLISNEVITRIEESNYDLKTILKEISIFKNPNYNPNCTTYKYQYRIHNKNEDKIKSYYESANLNKNGTKGPYKLKLPVDNKLLSNNYFKELLLSFVYVQKKLKQLRNSFNHFDNPTYNVEFIKKWIKVYIVLINSLEDAYLKMK